MSTVKIVLRVKNKDLALDPEAEFPLAVRITKDRKVSFIFIGLRIRIKDWDPKLQRVKKSHSNSVRLNNFIIKKLSQVTNASLESENENPDITAFMVKQKIRPRHSNTFFSQAELYLNQLKTAGKRNQYCAEKPRLDAFKRFIGTAEFPFSEINPTLLKRFQAWLKYDADGKVRSDRTVVNHLVPIRTIFNQAIASGVADQKHYPFGKGKIVIKYPESRKQGLTSKEIRRIETVDLTDNLAADHARNLWLFCFYLAGIRISDAFRLKWGDFEAGRLTYAMGKNNKVDSLKVPDKANLILEKYRRDNPKHDLVFPELGSLKNMNDNFSLQNRISQKAKRINELLQTVAERCKITKPLTNHISRHSFGNISGKRIPLQILQKLYRHSHISTTMNYQGNFIHDDVDNALDAVINSED